ncbi:MAG TPA: translation initiation factor IF-3 [Patescibacteria group bacterium]|nr:translation initiation factor IF-3 [Patescibacteria group bacterium]
MLRRFRRPKLKPLIPRYRINESIRVPEVKLIDDNDQFIGVVKIEDALARAKEAELDLVEIAPKETPPVCRIIGYGKFQYQLEKKIKEQKKKQKTVEVKGIRLSLRIGEHDLEIRHLKALEFLDNGDKVKIELILKGREHQHTDLARKIINTFIAKLGGDLYLEMPPSKQGGKLMAIVGRK